MSNFGWRGKFGSGRAFRPRAVTSLRFAPGRRAMAAMDGVPLFRRNVAAGRALRNRAATKIQQMFRKKRNPMRRKVVRGAIGGQATFSRLRLVNKPSPRVKAMKKVGAPNYYVSNEAAQLEVLEGFQEAGAWSFQNTNDLQKIALNIPGGGAAPVPRQFVLESTTAEYMITNSTLATMYVDVYDVIRKRDADSDEPATLNPREAWVIGEDNQYGVPGSLVYKNINSLPSDSRLLKDYFKIVQRSHISLAQGATHKHHVALKANKLIDTNLLDSKEPTEDLAGLSVYTMIVCYGQPSSIKVEGAPTVVTTASGAIDIVKCVRYKYTWIQDTATNYYFTDNLSTLTGEVVVSAGAGQIVPNAKA